jgi:hypothetical protein
VIIFQAILINTAVVATKYIYIFVVKNPSSLHDSFWCLFTNVWFLMIGSVFQFTNQFLPSKDGLSVSICVGHLDLTVKTSVKINYIARFFMMCSLLLYIFAAARMHYFKKKNYVHTISVTVSNQEAKFQQKLGNVFNLSFANVLTVGCTFLMLLPTIAIPYFFNQIDPKQLNQSPNYQLYQFSYHGLILLCFFSITLRFYLANKGMRTAVSREICEKMGAIHDTLYKCFT